MFVVLVSCSNKKVGLRQPCASGPKISWKKRKERRERRKEEEKKDTM